MDHDVKKQLIKAYNADAELREERDKGTRSGWKKIEQDNFIQLLKDSSLSSILELGAGTGIDSEAFIREGFTVLATDISPAMVEKCRSKGINAKVVDLYKVSQIGETFDAVFSMNVLLHVEREYLQTVIKEIAEVIDPGGIFYYGVYGGKDVERTFNDPSKMGMNRYFSFLSKESLMEITEPYFVVLDYHEIPQEDSYDEWFLFQSLTLQKK